MHLISAIDDCAQVYTESAVELANLYEMSSQYQLTVAGEDRTLQLRLLIKERRQELQDLELVFAYVKKLMEANCEVSFLLNAESTSTLTNQQIHSATKHIEEKFNSIRLTDLDLAQAHKIHIEKNVTENHRENQE